MTTFRLQAHPATPCPWIDSLEVTIERGAASIVLCRYDLHGDVDRIAIPSMTRSPARTDGLWQHTCFEVFAKSAEGESYCEFNFAPSGDWAAYRFDAYRAGMSELVLDSPPAIVVDRFPDRLTLSATLGARQLSAGPARIAASAVIEDRDGRLCYWALRHPDGKPDFHHPAGFAGLL